MAQPNALVCAELFVKLILSDWSLMPMLAQVTAAASRLVGAVVDASDPKAPAFITVRLQLRGDHLLVEVDHELTAVSAPVAQPGERVGVEQLGRSRTTWCQLPLPSGMSAGQVRLPRRGDRRTLVDEPVSGEPVAADPAVLDRLLTQLSGWSGPSQR